MERDLFLVCQPFFLVHFNSHAHVERDTFHAMLTRLKRISTHTLTWSVTWKPSTAYFNPKTFQLTRSRGAWRVITLSDPMKNLNFNSHAHVERDVMTFCLPCFSKFQLTRSRGAWPHVLRVLLLCRLFQLTRSRGAWPHVLRVLLLCRLFQLTRSRGAWLVRLFKLSHLSIFQLTRSRGAWHFALLL